MVTSKLCQLWLSCVDKEEADKIAHTLLTKHLVVCTKQVSAAADYWWKGKIEHADEVLLIMESKIDLFDKVEGEIKKLHSYDTFVLEAVLIDKASKDARKWLIRELKND